jgi:hypothetical protein
VRGAYAWNRGKNLAFPRVSDDLHQLRFQLLQVRLEQFEFSNELTLLKH